MGSANRLSRATELSFYPLNLHTDMYTTQWNRDDFDKDNFEKDCSGTQPKHHWNFKSVFFCWFVFAYNKKLNSLCSVILIASINSYTCRSTVSF